MLNYSQDSQTTNPSNHYLFPHITLSAMNHILYGDAKIEVTLQNGVKQIYHYCLNTLDDNEDSTNREMQYKVTISGCHSLSFANESNHIEIVDKVKIGEINTGEEIYEAKVKVRIPELNWNYKRKKYKTTFCPESWSKDKIASAIYEAFSNTNMKKVKDKKWISKTSSGIEFSGYFDTITGDLETAYITLGKYETF
jgi:hypothetical protein